MRWPTWIAGSRRAWLIALAPLPVLAGLGHVLAHQLAGQLATHAGADLSLAAETALERLPEPSHPAPLPPAPEARLVPLSEDASGPSQTPTDATPRSGGQRGLPPAKGLMVSRERVIRAANAGHRPSGTPVAAKPWRPAGIALTGVSAVGAGLLDGDVLTRVAGAPASSAAVVVGAVTAALRRGVPAISGEVWRGKQRIVVTVQLPQLEQRRDAPQRTRAAVTPPPRR